MSPCSVASNLYSVFLSEVLKSFILVSLDGGLIPSWNVVLKLAQQAFRTSQMKLLPLTQFKESIESCERGGAVQPGMNFK